MASDDKRYPDIAVRLRALRKAFSDDSRRQWATRCGFNQTQYTNWENGFRRIPLDAAEVMCRRFGVTLDWIYLDRWDGLSVQTRADLEKHIVR